ncbi:hypothetical protein K474DRAFT_1666932 [Panus rudis PR-1116 ss-1]|nr:hypothetical protein K474DRAFT_1666932 [Panus rudis PR-1116 ss-1]
MSNVLVQLLYDGSHVPRVHVSTAHGPECIVFPGQQILPIDPAGVDSILVDLSCGEVIQLYDCAVVNVQVYRELVRILRMCVITAQLSFNANKTLHDTWMIHVYRSNRQGLTLTWHRVVENARTRRVLVTAPLEGYLHLGIHFSRKTRIPGC